MTEVIGRSVWDYSELMSDENWKYALTDSDIEEIDSAIAYVINNQIPLESLNKQNFPLKHLSEKLEYLLQEINTGRGFVYITGLPVKKYNELESTVAYLGLSVYLGKLRCHNSHGWMMNRLIDMDRDKKNPNTLLAQTSIEFTTHTDSCDIVGILCIQNVSKENGGDTYVASSGAIHNKMLNDTPELLEQLFHEFPCDRRGQIPEGKDPWYMMPVFSWFHGNLTTWFHRQYINLVQGIYPEAPRVTEKEQLALKTFEKISTDPNYMINFHIESGDMIFMNNLTVVHGRTTWRDGDSFEDKRYLYRVWLCQESGIKIPDCYKDRWGSTTPGDRGGFYGKPNIKYKVPSLQEVIDDTAATAKKG
jgi:hypothetical protein